MVFGVITLAATVPLLATSTLQLQSESQKQKQHGEDQIKTVKCLLKVQATARMSQRRHDQLKDMILVVRDGAIFLDKADSTRTHPFMGYLLPFPEADYDGLVTTINDENFLNWTYIDKDTYQLKHGVRKEAQNQITGPVNVLPGRGGSDWRIGYFGWEGFLAVLGDDGTWAVYFDKEDNGLKGKVSTKDVVEIELVRIPIEDIAGGSSAASMSSGERNGVSRSQSQSTRGETSGSGVATHAVSNGPVQSSQTVTPRPSSPSLPAIGGLTIAQQDSSSQPSGQPSGSRDVTGTGSMGAEGAKGVATAITGGTVAGVVGAGAATAAGGGGAGATGAGGAGQDSRGAEAAGSASAQTQPNQGQQGGLIASGASNQGSKDTALSSQGQSQNQSQQPLNQPDPGQFGGSLDLWGMYKPENAFKGQQLQQQGVADLDLWGAFKQGWNGGGQQPPPPQQQQSVPQSHPQAPPAYSNQPQQGSGGGDLDLFGAFMKGWNEGGQSSQQQQPQPQPQSQQAAANPQGNLNIFQAFKQGWDEEAERQRQLRAQQQQGGQQQGGWRW